MSLYNFTPTPTPSWVSTFQPIVPRGLPSLGASGLGSLPGASGGILARGLPAATQSLASQIPFGSTLASRVPVGVGQEAFSAASALRPSASLTSRAASALPGAASVTSRLAPFSARAAGLGGVAGMVGSSLIDQLDIGGQNSNAEQFLQGAATGAGLGAGFGPMGAAIGGAAGGALGVLGNVLGFGGGDGESEAPEPVEILAQGIQAANLSPDQTESILETYEVLTTLAEAEDDDAAREVLLDQAYQQASQMILSAMAERETLGGMSSPGNLLALQSQAQDIFAPLASDIRESTALYANAMSGIRDNLPPQYQAIADANVARELSSADRLANAYSTQAAITPTVNQITQYQRDYNALAAQMFQQAQAQALGGGGTGQAADVSALLAQGI